MKNLFRNALTLFVMLAIVSVTNGQGKKDKNNSGDYAYNDGPRDGRYNDRGYDDRRGGRDYDDRRGGRDNGYDYYDECNDDFFDRDRVNYYEGRGNRNGRRWNAIERQALNETRAMDRALDLNRGQERRVARINLKYAQMMSRGNGYGARQSRFGYRKMAEMQRRKDLELQRVLGHRQYKRYLNLKRRSSSRANGYYSSDRGNRYGRSGW